MWRELRLALSPTLTRDVVHAGDGVVAAKQERAVVARITIPRRCEGRGRLTEGETGELDEHVFNRDITAAGGAEQVQATNRRGLVDRRRIQGVVAQRAELEVGLTKGTDDTVFSGGTGIDRQRHTGTGREVIAITVLLADITAPGRRIVDAAV